MFCLVLEGFLEVALNGSKVKQVLCPAATSWNDVTVAVPLNTGVNNINNALLYDALARIDATMREVVLMAYGLNMSDREIADETGLERRTVNRIGKRALKALREILEGEDF